MKKLKEKIKKFILKYFDYDIVGSYYETISEGHYQQKYIRKWRLRNKPRK